MRPVEQTILAPPEGNCFAACVASILEVGIDDVPNYVDGLWFHRWQNWLARQHGLVLFSQESNLLRPPPPGRHVIVGVESPRFAGKMHAVVGLDGAIVWDPHPDPEQLLKLVTDMRNKVVPLKDVSGEKLSAQARLAQRLFGDGIRWNNGKPTDQHASDIATAAVKHNIPADVITEELAELETATEEKPEKT